MNYLAHAYLSFNEASILLGNMISDFVKGKAQYDFPAKIHSGIKLHRLIDEFTDSHAVTAKMKNIFRPHYRLYAGAFVDVVYDHFLAKDSIRFQEYGGLRKFTLHTYSLLEENQLWFPHPFASIFPYMKKDNWLFHYREMEGIRKSFNGVMHRARYLSESDIAFALFQENYQELQNGYEEFFPELFIFTQEQFAEFKN